MHVRPPLQAFLRQAQADLLRHVHDLLRSFKLAIIGPELDVAPPYIYITPDFCMKPGT